jgi:uncharacterized Zn ribbon protein
MYQAIHELNISLIPLILTTITNLKARSYDPVGTTYQIKISGKVKNQNPNQEKKTEISCELNKLKYIRIRNSFVKFR